MTDFEHLQSISIIFREQWRKTVTPTPQIDQALELMGTYEQLSARPTAVVRRGVVFCRSVQTSDTTRTSDDASMHR
jgi:hypothetical protein